MLWSKLGFAALSHIRLFDQQILVASAEDFLIEFFDASGKKTRSVNKAYERLPISAAHKQQITDIWRLGPRTRKYWDAVQSIIKVPNTYPPISIVVCDDNHILVQTYNRREDGTEFFVFDKTGKEVKHLFLPLRYADFLQPYVYTFAAGNLFQLAEKNEEWELIITPLGL